MIMIIFFIILHFIWVDLIYQKYFLLLDLITTLTQTQRNDVKQANPIRVLPDQEYAFHFCFNMRPLLTGSAGEDKQEIQEVFAALTEVAEENRGGAARSSGGREEMFGEREGRKKHSKYKRHPQVQGGHRVFESH